MLHKLLKISIRLVLIIAAIVGLTSIYHPIILKWITGSARLIGKPIMPTVYTNGQINHNIKVFHVDKYWNGSGADYYILFINYLPDNNKLKIFSVNRKDNYVGIPSATSIKDYDLIGGQLFQGEVGSHFTPFQNNMKGYAFDPELTFNGKQFKLNIPPSAKELRYDSLRVEL